MHCPRGAALGLLAATSWRVDFAPEEPAKPEGNPFSRLASSTGAVLGGAASGLHHAMVEGPQNSEEAKWDKRGLLKTYRLFIAPMQQEAEAAHREGVAADQAKTGYQRAAHGMRATGHALATLVPGLGPVASQAGELIGQQLGKGDIAGAAGTAAGNIALYEAPHVAPKAMRGLARLGGAGIERTAEALTDTGPRGLKKMAKETVEANRKAAEDAENKNTEAARKHEEEKKIAEHETSGREQTYEQKVRTTDELARSKHAADVAKVREENARARARHAVDVEKVRAENDRIRAKHQTTANQIAQENAATDHALELRRAEEAGLKQDTTNYYAKEEAVRTKAKTKENSAWDKWRKKTAIPEDNVDMTPVIDVIQDQLTSTPEAANILRNVESQEGALDPDAQFYKSHRAEVMKYFGYEGDYENLPDDAKTNVDTMMSDGGRFPAGKPVNLAEIKSMPLEQIHSVKSNLGYKRFNRSYPPDVRYAMGKIYDSLDKLETAETIKRGGGDELKGAKQETRDYQEAFGQERHAPKTQNDIREREVNPEEYKAKKDQERLNAAKKYDASLVDDYEKVKARREQLKKMPMEDQLRKTRKQIPPPPSPDDLREGYRLKPEPEPPTEDDLRPGYRLQSEPEPPAPATEMVEQPPRVTAPPQPPDIVPERKTLGPEEISANRTAKSQGAAQRLRDAGVRRALYIMASSTLGAIALAATGHPTWAFLSLAQAPMALLGSHALANLFDSPKFTERLGKITSRDLAAVSKLPPQEQAVFKQNLGQMVNMAKQRGVPVSPALRAFVVGSAVAPSTTKTMQQLRQETEQRRAAGLAGATPAASAAPGETMQEVPPEVSGLVPAEPTTSAPAAPGASAPTELPITTDESDTGY